MSRGIGVLGRRIAFPGRMSDRLVDVRLRRLMRLVLKAVVNGRTRNPEYDGGMSSANRQHGVLLGLAIGDALGAAVEFHMPGTFPEVSGYRGGGPHGLAPGEWTDDTSMALALADSIASVGWDLDEQVLAAKWEPLQRLKQIHALHPEVADVAAGSFRRKKPPEVVGSGYVVKSLEAALWAFHDAKDFREAVLRAVNLGDDADTTGAICGQLAGAYWGESGIPQEWREGLARPEMIEKALQGLLKDGSRNTC